MFMKYLITGGAGFIGSNYLNYMVNKYSNDFFVCLDSLTYASNISNLDSLNKKGNYKFVKGSICNKKLLNELFKKEHFDIVINFAAESHVTKSITEPDVFMKTNYFGTFNLLEMSKKYKVKRYHQISTDEVYGTLKLEDVGVKFNEEYPLNPSTPYAVSKASADLLVLSYFKTYKLPITISRCSNNYGPFQHEEKFIPLVIKNLINHKSIPIYGNGLHVRDWIYVLDHVKAIEMIINKGIAGNVYNIGGNNELNSLQIVEAITNKIKIISNMKYVEDRLANDIRYSIDSTKLEKELGWTREVTFDDALSQTINWYLDKYEKKNN